ncbi:MAG TPA: response regulator [Anaeromyxobacteraceae bacterium]|nr:response regulator [Anaeromyxobacteraceae bacterium]
MPPRRRLLVVEDDIDVREVLVDALRAEGYAVEAARNGQEALALLAVGPVPDAIVLDLLMPVMNGWQFREAQLRDTALARIPVIVVSASAPGSIGASVHLTKPFELATLIAAVERVAAGGALQT